MNESDLFNPGPTPDVFAQDFQRATGQVHLVRLGEADYTAASFLDQRILDANRPARWVDWGDVAATATNLPLRAGPDYIFHIGHTGSTLLSRILGDHPKVFSLREPPWMRTLATSFAGTDHVPPHAALQTLTKLTARTYRPEQRALIKVTSFASELAPQLLSSSPGARVIGLIAAPQVHMATLLAGEHNMIEVDALGPTRLGRIRTRAPGFASDWNDLSLGARLAATWLAEMTSLSQALTIAGPAGLALDFDGFLANRAAALHGVLTHLHGLADTADVGALAASNHFSRYSKAQSFDYSPQLRADLLNQAWQNHGPDLKAGLTWLDAQLRQHSEIAGMLGPFLA